MIELPRATFGLNPQELLFLETLCNAPRPVVSHFEMATAISKRGPESRIAAVTACKAKKKLASTFTQPIIETVWGRGYRLADGARDAILAAACFEMREAA